MFSPRAFRARKPQPRDRARLAKKMSYIRLYYIILYDIILYYNIV